MTFNIQLEPEARAFAEMIARPPFLFDQELKKARTALDEAQSSSVVKLPVDNQDLIIENGPSNHVAIRILKPQGITNPLPTIVYIHGTRWVFGNKLTHDRLLQELAVGAGAAIIFPSFSLSPESKYPTAVEENYSVVRWVAKYGAEYGLDAQRLAIAGDSSGGNLAAAVTLLSKERGGPDIQLQLLFYPVTDASFDTESYHRFAEGYHLRRDEMIWFWNQYTTSQNERNEITVSPLRASTEQLKGLPKALVITAEADILRDEGEAYANKLRKAGVSVTAVRFQGTIHDFVMLNTLSNTAAARGAISFATAWLREEFLPHHTSSTRPS